MYSLHQYNYKSLEFTKDLGFFAKIQENETKGH